MSKAAIGIALAIVFLALSPVLGLMFFMPFLAAPSIMPAPLAGGGLPPGPVRAYVPSEIQYRDRSGLYPALIAWLESRDSAIADPARLAEIEEAGRAYNVDPLLLLAITGQEQSFVPKRGNWQAVMQNPWNVFGSWQRWQGGFSASAQWAAHTVVRLSQGCPENVSVIRWVNGLDNTGRRANPNWGYAGDPNWWRGVSFFYGQLQEIAKGG